MESTLIVLGIFACMIPIGAILVLISKLANNAKKIRRLKMLAENLSKLSGRQKRAAMLKAAIPLQKPELRDKKRMAKAAETMFFQKESDWAIAGGIASGIAGPIAGAAAAMNTQLENARIREYNRTTGVAMTNLVSGVMSNAVSRIEASMYGMEGEIANINQVPVLSVPANELFDKIKFSDVDFKSANGKRIIEAVVCLKEEYVHDKISMCIDGYLNAEIKDGDQVVENVVLILPLEGITTVPRKIKGLCMKAKGSSYSLSAKFSAGNIWAMEKRCGIFTAKTIFALGGSRQEDLVDAMAMHMITGVWTDVGESFGYIWGYNQQSHKARIWDYAEREITRMDNVYSTVKVIDKCRELQGKKN